MPWLRLCRPVANARNRSLLCASGASITQFRLREARVREPICAEPDSRDLGVADPQRDVRLEHIHPFLIGGSLVGCRLSPVLHPRVSKREAGRASKASGVGATAERYGPPKGCSAGLLARSRATIQTIERWRWFTRQTRPRSHKFGASHPRRSNPGLALEQRTGLNISQSRSRPMPSHLLVPIGDLKQWHLPFKRHRPRRRP
jgi:hypothetical protein